MGKPQLEAETCDVAVTAVALTLSIRLTTGEEFNLTMPRQMGEDLAWKISAGLAAGEEKKRPPA